MRLMRFCIVCFALVVQQKSASYPSYIAIKSYVTPDRASMIYTRAQPHATRPPGPTGPNPIEPPHAASGSTDAEQDPGMVGLSQSAIPPLLAPCARPDTHTHHSFRPRSGSSTPHRAELASQSCAAAAGRGATHCPRRPARRSWSATSRAALPFSGLALRHLHRHRPLVHGSGMVSALRT